MNLKEIRVQALSQSFSKFLFARDWQIRMADNDTFNLA
jgi:hypothetical protein